MRPGFEQLRMKIMGRVKHDLPGSAEKGDKRELFVESILVKMRDEGEIFSYIKVPKFSYADVEEGIDFYVIIIRKERIVIPLQVTGPRFVLEHKERHPEIDIVSVPDEGEKEGEVYDQINTIINRF